MALCFISPVSKCFVWQRNMAVFVVVDDENDDDDCKLVDDEEEEDDDFGDFISK